MWLTQLIQLMFYDSLKNLQQPCLLLLSTGLLLCLTHKAAHWNLNANSNWQARLSSVTTTYVSQ